MKNAYIPALVAIICPLWSFGAALDTIVAVKSFIHAIDTSTVGKCVGAVETLFSGLPDCKFAEHPGTPAPDKADYRLRSALAVRAECDANSTITAWNLKPPEASFGYDGFVLAGKGDFGRGLTAQPSVWGTKSRRVTFEYTLRGRPDEAADALFDAVKPRTCQYIWHKVQGTLTCNGATPRLDVRLTGSRFPSHRAWVGKHLVTDISEGPLINLWMCDSISSALIQ